MTVSRRSFIQGLSAFTLLPLVTACGGSEASASSSADNGSGSTPTTPVTPVAGTTFVMPEEGATHAATWMAYGATAGAWGTTGVYGVSRAVARKDLMRIAANLSRFENVSMLVNTSDKVEAQAYLAAVSAESAPLANKNLPAIGAGGTVTLIEQAVNDLWTRDTAPVFVTASDKKLTAVNFNFNGWGQVAPSTGLTGWVKDANKKANGIQDQPITDDQIIANFIIAKTGAVTVSTWLCMEGGGIEVNGLGTAICTESCILNNNRNPGKTKADVEVELLRVLGVKKVIWLPGKKAMDITDGHVDFYARFVDETTVLYTLDLDTQSPDNAATLENQKILNKATTVDGKTIKAIALVSPDFTVIEPNVIARNTNTANFKFNKTGFAAGYVGFYEANGCILMAGFGDAAADKAAYDIIVAQFPNRTVMQITTDGIANGGGTIHCATQQQIA